MCLAVYKPANMIIPDAYFEAGFDNNSNGAGFCFHNGEQLFYVKGLMTIADFLATYHAHVKPEYAALIHFRYATLGPRDKEHTHPFVTSDGSCLIHNGPQIQSLGCTKRSDTREFVEDVINSLDFETMRKAAPLVEAYLEYNKVVVMSPTGEVQIFNEDGGHWLNGCWYSNDGYKDWGSSSYMSRRLSSTKDWSHEGWLSSASTGRTSAFAGSYTETMLRQAAEDSLRQRAAVNFREGLRMASIQEQHYIEEHVDEEDFFEAFDEFFFRDVGTGQYVELSMLMYYAAFAKMMHEEEEEIDDLIATTMSMEVEAIRDEWETDGMRETTLHKHANNDASNIIEWPSPPTPPNSMIVIGIPPEEVEADRRVG